MGPPPKKKYSFFYILIFYISYYILLVFTSIFHSVFNKCEMIKSARYPEIAIWYSLKKTPTLTLNSTILSPLQFYSSIS